MAVFDSVSTRAAADFRSWFPILADKADLLADNRVLVEESEGLRRERDETEGGNVVLTRKLNLKDREIARLEAEIAMMRPVW
jgi:hypothetical protein